MNIVFFGTDSLAAHALVALHSAQNVLAVVTVPDAPVGRKQVLAQTPVGVAASELGIPVLKPARLKNNDEFLQQLKSLAPDALVVAVYSKIIPDSVLSVPPRGSINVHPSLLPLYRGPAPIRTPLLRGDSVTGVSIMLMDAEVDHGPLLAVEQVAIAPEDTNATLTEKLSGVAAPLLVRTLAEYEKGNVTPQEQDHTMATFTKMVTKEDGRVNWQKPAREIYNMWRAYQPWPGIFTTWNGKLLKILACAPLDAVLDAGHASGTVLGDGVIACGDGSGLQILTLQLEGKNATDFQSFTRGNGSFIGSVLF